MNLTPDVDKFIPYSTLEWMDRCQFNINEDHHQSYRPVVLDMTMSLYLFLDMYLHSGEYHVGTVGIDIRNYIFAVLMR